MGRMTASVEHIARQREAGWPDIHPEDYCHKCGTQNMLWVANQGDWLAATASWATQTGREGICCPQCFAEMHEDQTGERVVWVLTPYEWSTA